MCNAHKNYQQTLVPCSHLVCADCLPKLKGKCALCTAKIRKSVRCNVGSLVLARRCEVERHMVPGQTRTRQPDPEDPTRNANASEEADQLARDRALALELQREDLGEVASGPGTPPDPWRFTDSDDTADLLIELRREQMEGASSPAPGPSGLQQSG